MSRRQVGSSTSNSASNPLAQEGRGAGRLEQRPQPRADAAQAEILPARCRAHHERSSQEPCSAGEQSPGCARSARRRRTRTRFARVQDEGSRPRDGAIVWCRVPGDVAAVNRRREQRRIPGLDHRVSVPRRLDVRRRIPPRNAPETEAARPVDAARPARAVAPSSRMLPAAACNLRARRPNAGARPRPRDPRTQRMPRISFMKSFRRMASALWRESIARSGPHGLANVGYLRRRPVPSVALHRSLWLASLPGGPRPLALLVEANLWVRWTFFGAWRATWRVVRRRGAEACAADGVPIGRHGPARARAGAALEACRRPRLLSVRTARGPPRASAARPIRRCATSSPRRRARGIDT